MTKNFEYFKNGIGGQLCKRRLSLDLTNIHSWNELQDYIIGNCTDLLPKIKDAHAHMSSGEKPIVEAILWACDFASQADELSNGKTYYNLLSMSGDHKKTYLAILEQK